MLFGERGIQTSVHYPPIHSFTHYGEVSKRGLLPRTEDIASRLLTLPLYAYMDDARSDAVVDALLTPSSNCWRSWSREPLHLRCAGRDRGARGGLHDHRDPEDSAPRTWLYLTLRRGVEQSGSSPGS
jgi:hypothetical protein